MSTCYSPSKASSRPTPLNLTAILAGATVALVLWIVALSIRGPEGRSAGSVTLAGPHSAAGRGHNPPLPEGELHLSAKGVHGRRPPRGSGGCLRWRSWLASTVARSQWAALLAFAVGAGALFFLSTKSLHERYWDGHVAAHVACLAGAVAIAYGGRLAAEAQGRTIEAALAVALATLGAAFALGESTGVTAMDATALSSSAGLFGLMLAALAKLCPDDKRPLAPVGSRRGDYPSRALRGPARQRRPLCRDAAKGRVTAPCGAALGATARPLVPGNRSSGSP